MAKRSLPTLDRLRKLLDYDPETGALTWRSLEPTDFKEGKRTAQHSCRIWNSVNAGKAALSCLNELGYLVGGIDYNLAAQHRVIWKWMTGETPKEVDHINGVRSDNRWGNLRHVDRTGNQRNLALPTTNTSGVIGVSRNRKAWVATGTVGGKTVTIGRFPTIDEATVARRAWEVERGYHPSHGLR